MLSSSSAVPSSSIHNYDYFESEPDDKKVKIKQRMYKDFRRVIENSGIVKGTKKLQRKNYYWSHRPFPNLITNYDLNAVRLWSKETNIAYSNAFKQHRKPVSPATDGEEKVPYNSESTCNCRTDINSKDFEIDCFGDNTIDYKQTEPQKKIVRQEYWRELMRFNMEAPSILEASSLEEFQRAIFQHNQGRLKYYDYIQTSGSKPNEIEFCYQVPITHEFMDIFECRALKSSSTDVLSQKWKIFKRCMNNQTSYVLQPSFKYELVAWTALSNACRADMIVYRLSAVLKPKNDSTKTTRTFAHETKMKMHDTDTDTDIDVPVFEILYKRPKCQNAYSESCAKKGPKSRPNNRLVLKFMKKRQTKERNYDRELTQKI